MGRFDHRDIDAVLQASGSLAKVFEPMAMRLVIDDEKQRPVAVWSGQWEVT